MASSLAMSALRCLLPVVLFLGVVSGGLEPLKAGWTERDPLVKQARKLSVAPLEHTSMTDVLKRLKNMQEDMPSPGGPRYRRQSGQPSYDRHEFTGDNSRYARIHYSGDMSSVIFVLTYDFAQGLPTHTNLYRSDNYGATFTNIESNLDPDEVDPLLWINFYISPSNKNMLVFPHATEPKFYYSKDEGRTWDIQDLNPSSINPRSLLWNSNEGNWMIAHDSNNDHLYVTQDLGKTWSKIAEHVDSPSDYQWGVMGVDDSHSTIFFNTFDPNDHDRGDFTVDLFTIKYPYVPESVEEFDPNLGKHDDFVIVGPYIFVQKSIGGDSKALLVSYNRNPFHRAMIPSSEPHFDYLISHINSLQAQVIVKHAGEVYNLYLSDVTGIYYSLSLPDIVVSSGTGVTDLERIEGLNSTLMANQFVRLDATETNPPVRTLISLDNGGNWELVRPPPEFDSEPCEPPRCSLHLHMGTSEFARLGVYSQASAPGIILALGNLGEALLSDPDLYISRDGGVSWEMTIEGSWGVTVADHGGLMVAARDYHQNPSNEIKYSCDEGLSWVPFEFDNLFGDSIIVFGVITEPGEHTAIVSLYGIESTSTFYWVVLTLNLTSIFPQVCGDDDYYDWLPWDERLDGEECMLGSSITIERRKVDVCCLNGREYDREFNFEICMCAEEDFECDYGYMRADGFTGPCVSDPEVDIGDPCAFGNVTTYLRSRGYRKIAGDVCEGGDEQEFQPYIAKCCEIAGPTELPTGSPTEPPPEPTGTTGPTKSPEGQRGEGGGGDDNKAAIALGIILAVAAIAILGLCIAIIMFSMKLSKLRRQYIRVATEPHERFSFQPNSSPEPETPATTVPRSPVAQDPVYKYQDDDDDEPIVP